MSDLGDMMARALAIEIAIIVGAAAIFGGTVVGVFWFFLR